MTWYLPNSSCKWELLPLILSCVDKAVCLQSQTIECSLPDALLKIEALEITENWRQF
jgi:hypothetical protein